MTNKKDELSPKPDRPGTHHDLSALYSPDCIDMTHASSATSFIGPEGTVHIFRDIQTPIDTDKFKLSLREKVAQLMDQTKKQYRWRAPASIVATVLVALLTSDFKNFLGLPALWWQIVFYLLLASCIALIVKDVFNIWRQLRNNKSIDQQLSSLADTILADCKIESQAEKEHASWLKKGA